MIGVRAARPPVDFLLDAAFAERMASLSATVGPAIEADVEALVNEPVADPVDGSTIPASAAAALVTRHRLESTVELALLALPVARAMSSPPISGYRVGAIGIEAGTGDLVLGGNLEFPGSELGATIHAEGFVALRARRRGRSLATLAVRRASPCAHCRQTLAEFAEADALTIVDLRGYSVTLADLYPWAFEPSALDMLGDAPDAVGWPNLAFAAAPSPAPPAPVAAELLTAGIRAHAPYSGAPSAAVLRLRDGRMVSAACVESVAFNPSISALQAVLIELVVLRAEVAEITEAWLAGLAEGRIDPEPGFRALLAAVAPGAVAHVARWRSASA